MNVKIKKNVQVNSRVLVGEEGFWIERENDTVFGLMIPEAVSLEIWKRFAVAFVMLGVFLIYPWLFLVQITQLTFVIILGVFLTQLIHTYTSKIDLIQIILLYHFDKVKIKFFI